MIAALKDERIQRILRLPGEAEDAWHVDLGRFQRGHVTLTRHSAGESSIKAIQRLLIFLGYSTASSGAFLIDGDFGRGTNRAVAQFQFEHGLTRSINRQALRKVGAASAVAMYSSGLAEQVAQVARFLLSNAKIAAVVGKSSPREEDFRPVARYYNGSGYEKHHYHESLVTWFREFRQ